MKKKIFLFFLFLLNFNYLNANEGVYFLDVDYILKNSDSGKIVVKKLQNLNSENNLMFKNAEDEIKLLENEITKVKNIVSNEELNKKIQNLKKKIVVFRENKNTKLNEYNDFKKKELEDYFKRISPIVEEFMKMKSIKIIIDRKNIFIADANYDITNELIKFLNEKIN
jgi:outer membrane protein